MEWIHQLLLTIIPMCLTGVGGWVVARKKQNNDFLHDMQLSINMLSSKNSELLAEVIALRGENATLLHNQENLKREMEGLRSENGRLSSEVSRLNELLTNVKSITRTK